ncbi:hypothetical protein F2Q69_00038206 [Brassica cretica]|uniref:Uncharacterized protein n=1 Tax=Brassica cretica TaxID=69181 RepID=A0A8S9SGY6_BRACR|nr:hypothetical protein F2Q69_00038206 [Brassica cretica]
MRPRRSVPSGGSRAQVVGVSLFRCKDGSLTFFRQCRGDPKVKLFPLVLGGSALRELTALHVVNERIVETWRSQRLNSPFKRTRAVSFFLVVECSGLRGGFLRVVELSHPTVVEITTMYSRLPWIRVRDHLVSVPGCC